MSHQYCQKNIFEKEKYFDSFKLSILNVLDGNNTNNFQLWI